MTRTAPDVPGAHRCIDVARAVLDRAARQLAGRGAVDEHQVFAYDLAHSAAGLSTAAAALGHASAGQAEASLATAFVGEAVWELQSRLAGREELWGVAPGSLDGCAGFLASHRDPLWLASLAEVEAPRHLAAEYELVASTFRRFADERIAPLAEGIHRENRDVPEEVITGLSELGAFGLSIPEEYGGFAAGREHDYLGMVLATEELSRSSLGVGGSLITRPEILARALLAGGTEDQKHRWLPRLASGELMAGVAVTEPDHGSDVAGITFAGTADGDGWLLNGTKTWSTFAARADVLMVLARTDPDRRLGHKGLSLFVVPKARAAGRGFVLEQDGGGRLEGRPIGTIGYRGMHSYELSFDSWRVAGDCLVGGPDGLGRGFYLQMAGFESGRLQTVARAVGVMQAAFEAASAYAGGRTVFGHPLADYQLTRVKLARMAAVIASARWYMYDVARTMALSGASLEASMAKAYVCRAAEWVTREAMQIHGGMGYAEEFPVSRYFLDARVLSIFEGADETLALKVIARRLAEQAG